MITALIAIKYHGSIRAFDRSVTKILYDYENALRNKKTAVVSAAVVSTKAKKAPVKKTPSLKSKSIGSNKPEKVINRKIIRRQLVNSTKLVLKSVYTIIVATLHNWIRKILTFNLFLLL